MLLINRAYPQWPPANSTSGPPGHADSAFARPAGRVGNCPALGWTYSSGVAPPVRTTGRGFDWSTASIALSIAGAAISLADKGLFLVGIAVFVLGLIAGVVGWRSGIRRNRAGIGIILNSANLILDIGLLISAASR